MEIKQSEANFFQINPTAQHRVVPPTFHKICVYVISFRRLCFLSFQKIYAFMGLPSNSCALHLHKSVTLFNYPGTQTYVPFLF